MVSLSAVWRRTLSRVTYAFGLLAVLGAATALLITARVPAHPATPLSTPVPAPTSEPTAPDDHPTDPGHPGDGSAYAGQAGSGAGAVIPAGSPHAAPVHHRADRSTAVGPAHAAARRGGPVLDARRSLLWSGLVGLAISLAGLTMVGTRRRRW